MRMTNLLVSTRKEFPSDAEAISHQLLIKAGLLRQTASGIYSYLPTGLKALKNIENVIREEMDKAGAQEVLLPALLPIEPYEQSGRSQKYGDDMFRLKDRNNRDFCLGPTHEEIITELAKNEVKSYRQLPVNLYQVQTKFRDERRPRFGLMRCREFIMKDAYSFDKDYDGLDVTYNKMTVAYRRLFTRVGLNFTVVLADSGAIGGSNSQEFMVISDTGEDEIITCNNCGYGSNIEKASCPIPEKNNTKQAGIEKIHTPDVKTIEQLCNFLKVPAETFAKTLIYKVDGKLVAVMIRGDRELNEVKLANLIGDVNEIAPAEGFEVTNVTNAAVGFAGPVGLNIPTYVDNEVAHMVNMTVGANETDYHLKNVNIDRDFKATQISDLRNITDNDPCPSCSGNIEIKRGIEVGHVFKLGTKYSEILGCTFLDDEGNTMPMVMGCYGIGVGRTLAAVIEQNNDEYGIIWPCNIAPYKAIVVPVSESDEIQMGLAENIYDDLINNSVETLIDDRAERAGVKFKDSELMGIPVRITVGRKAAEGIVEIKVRKTGETIEVKAEEASAKAIEIINKLTAECNNVSI